MSKWLFLKLPTLTVFICYLVNCISMETISSIDLLNSNLIVHILLGNSLSLTEQLPSYLLIFIVSVLAMFRYNLYRFALKNIMLLALLAVIINAIYMVGLLSYLLLTSYLSLAINQSTFFITLFNILFQLILYIAIGYITYHFISVFSDFFVHDEKKDIEQQAIVQIHLILYIVLVMFISLFFISSLFVNVDPLNLYIAFAIVFIVIYFVIQGCFVATYDAIQISLIVKSSILSLILSIILNIVALIFEFYFINHFVNQLNHLSFDFIMIIGWVLQLSFTCCILRGVVNSYFGLSVNEILK